MKEEIDPAKDDSLLEFAVEGDDFFDSFYPWREMSADEYAARRAHGIGSYAMHKMRYRNPEMAKWAKRLGELVADDKELDRVRRQLLTPKEYAKVQREIASIREHGL